MVLPVKPQPTVAQASGPGCLVRTSGTGPGGRQICTYESWEQRMTATARGFGHSCVQSSLYGFVREPHL